MKKITLDWGGSVMKVYRTNLISHLVIFIFLFFSSAAQAGFLINIDTGAYSGNWRILGETGTLSGNQIVNLDPGTHTMSVGISNFGFFDFTVDGIGDVTSLNVGAATSSGNTLTFNAATINIDVGAFNSAENTWSVSGVEFNATGNQIITVVPGVGYLFSVGRLNLGNIIFDVDAAGNVISQNTDAADGSGNTLILNTTSINVDVGIFNSAENTWSITGVEFSATGNQTVTVVPGVGYAFFVGRLNLGQINFAVDAAGNVISQNTVAATGSGNTLTLNTTEIDITPNTGNLWSIFGVRGNLPGADAVTVVPGVSYQLKSGAGSDTFAVAEPCAITPNQLLVGGTNFDLGCTPPNNAPTADAGADQSIRAGDTVSLNGSASFDDNTASAALDYDWSFFSLPGGSIATLDDATSATPSFVADVAGTYVVELVVTDEGLLSSPPDQVGISSDNLAPTAAAGDDQLVIISTVVVLDGSGSADPEGDGPLFFDWTITAKPAGSNATLTNYATASPFLTPDLEGVYEVTLAVSDFIGPGAPDSVEITATTAESFAEDRILCAADIVSGLGPDQVTTKGNQKAFGNFMSQAVSAIQEGDKATAIDKLEKSIERTDGCEAIGIPDGNGPERDWIIDCDAQAPILICLTEAVDALTP